MKKSYLSVMLATCLTAQAQVPDPEVKIEARIIGETGQAISNASVSVWFRKLKTNNPFDGQESISRKGVTDEQGIYVAINQTLARCGVAAEKEGYYPSREQLLLEDKDGNWVPWHQVVSLQLRKKESPTAMYAKRLHYVAMPTTDSPAGYDLMAGDWVAPHGKGAVQDLVFTLQREFQGRYDFKWQLSVQFAGDGNGWQAISPTEETPQSELRFPRTVPADGYTFSNMFLAYSRGSFGRMETNSATATNYFFRVRSEYDANKQLKSAHYGKMLGPIQVNVQGTKTAKLSFTYYLNPAALDRNIEFDPQKNLFKNLPGMEQVQNP
jgi:hypothetical protein